MDDENSLRVSEPLQSECQNDALTVQRACATVMKVTGFSVSVCVFVPLLLVTFWNLCSEFQTLFFYPQGPSFSRSNSQSYVSEVIGASAALDQAATLPHVPQLKISSKVLPLRVGNVFRVLVNVSFFFSFFLHFFCFLLSKEAVGLPLVLLIYLARCAQLCHVNVTGDQIEVFEQVFVD